MTTPATTAVVLRGAPEYLMRALPYRDSSVDTEDTCNDPSAWEFETALAIVDQTVNALDASNLKTAPCEVCAERLGLRACAPP